MPESEFVLGLCFISGASDLRSFLSVCVLVQIGFHVFILFIIIMTRFGSPNADFFRIYCISPPLISLGVYLFVLIFQIDLCFWCLTGVYYQKSLTPFLISDCFG